MHPLAVHTPADGCRWTRAQFSHCQTDVRSVAFTMLSPSSSKHQSVMAFEATSACSKSAFSCSCPSAVFGSERPHVSVEGLPWVAHVSSPPARTPTGEAEDADDGPRRLKWSVARQRKRGQLRSRCGSNQPMPIDSTSRPPRLNIASATKSSSNLEPSSSPLVR